MKVYVLTYQMCYNDPNEIIGVFSSMEKLESYKKEKFNNYACAYLWNEKFWTVQGYIIDEGEQSKNKTL